MGIEMGRVSGPLLSENLLRNGEDLAFETKLLYLNVNTGTVGVNTDSPSHQLTVNGTTSTINLVVDTQSDIANFSILTNKIQNPIGSIYITPNQSLTPTVTLTELQTANLSISNQKIENLITDDNINLSPNGLGIVKFTTPSVNVSGWMHATGNVTWDGIITLGDSNLDSVSFGADITSSILPNVNDAVDLGSTSKYWQSLYTTNVITTNITATTNITSNNISLVLLPGYTIYVATTGNDLSSGRHANAPYLTIKTALANAVSGDEIVIFPGTYTEIFPLTVPQGVSIRGMDIRNVIVKPTSGTNTNNAFLLNGDTTVSFLTVRDFYSPGNGFSFASNFTITSRSPYVYNVTVITASATLPGNPVGSALFPTNSYLAVGTAITLGKTCTVEGWFRTTLDPASSKIVLVGGNGNRGISIYNGQYGQNSFSATKFTVDWEYAGNIEFTVPTMVANTWYHLAVTQTATGVMTLWLNGVRSSTGTLTPNWTFQAQNYRIGGWQTQAIYSQGVYITNVRMTTTAVYDVTQSNITVPTSPLTAIAGTQLLLLEDTSVNLLKDSSANNRTITNSGTVTWSALSPITNSGTLLSAGSGALVDGSLANSASTSASMLFNAVTMIVPDAIGIHATNGSRVEWNNSFTYFANKGIYLTTGTLGFSNLGIKFGAEFRSINSANIYGTYGAVADGASTKGYLSSHNFSYIGSGSSSINDPSAVIQANAIVAIDGGILYYDSMDHQGDFRVGDIFYVNQQTGTVIFNAQRINFGSRGSIVFETIDGITRIDAYGIQTGNIRIHDNNIDSLIGPINITAASGSTRLSTNVFVTGLINLTGDAIVKGNVFLGNDILDTLTITPNLSQTFKPAGLTYTLGTSDYRWNNALVKLINVDGVTQLTTNTISTLTTNTDLRLVAAGIGKLQISTTDVQISNSATINDLTINGDTSLKNTQIAGLVTLVGDINQTGNINLTGTLANSSDIYIVSSSSYLQSYGVKILNNQISSVISGTDLTLTANGTGGVIFDNNLNFTDTIISNRWINATTDLQKSIVFLPNSTGKTILDTTKFLTLPYSNDSTKILSALGEIRQNSTSTLYEGYLSSGVATRFNNLYDNDLNTYITAELANGDNDNILRFAANGSVRATIDSTMLYTSLLEIDNIQIFENTINNYVAADTLIFAQNGSGVIHINDLVFKPNKIQLSTDQILILESTNNGYFKFGGSGGLVIPSGTDAQRRDLPLVGETRYNTTSQIIEVFNGTIWDTAVGSAEFATPEEVNDIMNTWSIILG